MFPILRSLYMGVSNLLWFYAATDTSELIPKLQIKKWEQIIYYKTCIWNLLQITDNIVRTLTWGSLFWHCPQSFIMFLFTGYYTYG